MKSVEQKGEILIYIVTVLEHLTEYNLLMITVLNAVDIVKELSEIGGRYGEVDLTVEADKLADQENEITAKQI